MIKDYNVDSETHDELIGILEDSIEFFCDEFRISGELAWIITEVYATRKIAEFEEANR